MSLSYTQLQPTQVKPKRSRKGCQECRRLHQKCNEARPACGACARAGKTCCYNQVLSWGGRPFKQSSFGKVVAASGVVLVPSEPSDTSPSDTTRSFVFSLNSNHTKKTLSRQKRTAALEMSSGYAAKISIYPDPSWIPWATPAQLSLLHHFSHTLVPCFTLCPSQRDVLCRSLLPLAVDREQGGPLFSAVMLSALVHRDAINSLESDKRSATLYQTCIRHLQQAWAGQSSFIDSISIATALILCLTGILAGGFQQDAWRLHLNGAAALLDSTLPKSLLQCEYLCPTRAFMQRWCRSLRSVGSSSASRLSPLFRVDVDNEDSVSHTGHYINVFDGFSTDLLPIRQQISEMVQEKRAIQNLGSNTSESSQHINSLRTLLENRCIRLISKIEAMLDNLIQTLDPHFPREQLEPYHSDFVALNQVYHYVAILELYQRVLDRPQTDRGVQNMLNAAVIAMKRVTFTDGASPGVAALHAVFIMGCSAVSPQTRSSIIAWIDEMCRRYRMANVTSAKIFLLQLWQRNDKLPSTKSHVQWDQFMLEQNWDLSLY